MTDSLLAKLEKEKLVLKRGLWYYCKIDGKEISLGNRKDTVEGKLKAIDVKTLSSFVATPEAPKKEESKKENEALHTPGEVTISAPTNEEKVTGIPESVLKALSSIGKVRVEGSSTSDFAVFVKGVNVLQTSHPAVKACPLYFHYMRNVRAIKEGGKTRNGDYSQLSKSQHKELIEYYGITVSRDDTQDSDFYSVGNQTLFVCDFETHFQKKEYQRAKYGTAKHLETMAKRQEFALSQSHEKDPEQIVKNFENINQVSQSEHASHSSAALSLAKLTHMEKSGASGVDYAKEVDKMAAAQGMLAHGY